MRTIKISITNDSSYLAYIRRFVYAIGIEEGYTEDDISDISIATDEALTNVIKYAYGDTSGDIEISFFMEADKFSVLIVDQGKTFNPSPISIPDIEKRIKQRAKGGLGRYLMRRVMDVIEYKAQPRGGNELLMVKYL